MHNLPAGPGIKSIFTSRYKGGCIAMPDGAQMEIRILSVESGDENLIQAFRDGVDIHRFFACFTGDTKVKLPNGEDVRIDELQYLDKKDMYCYSYNKENNVIEIKPFINPTLTKYVDKLVEVELYDGTVVKCTPEHLFMLSDGTYKEAQYLTEDDDIMTVY